jgi:NAD(P)-dependent dehydrogenase (short-subunit alcohol dehydrogenase family)
MTRIALVTGGTEGLGLGIARHLGRAGCALVLAARSPEKGDGAVATLTAEGFDVSYLPVDVSDEEHVGKLFDILTTRFGKLDVLVNNAGFPKAGPLRTYATVDWRRLIGTHLTGTFLCCRAAYPLLKRGDMPAVVNIGSTAGLAGPANTAAYACVKGGIYAFSQALATEWAPEGIRVNTVAPGAALSHPEGQDSEKTQRRARMIPVGHLATIDEVAAGVAFLASPAAAGIIGHCLVIDGGSMGAGMYCANVYADREDLGHDSSPSQTN